MFHQNESIFPGSSIVRPLGATVVRAACCILDRDSRTGTFSGVFTCLGNNHPGNLQLAGFAGGGGSSAGAVAGGERIWLALGTILSYDGIC